MDEQQDQPTIQSRTERLLQRTDPLIARLEEDTFDMEPMTRGFWGRLKIVEVFLKARGALIRELKGPALLSGRPRFLRPEGTADMGGRRRLSGTSLACSRKR